MYVCELCEGLHLSRESLQFLYVKTLPFEDGAVFHFNFVVCKEPCADVIRKDAETDHVLVDEPFAGNYEEER